MSNASTCPRCGAALDAPAASCSACLMGLAGETPPNQRLGPGFLDDLPLPRETVLISGKYEILDTLARGGMGVVYRARSLDLKRTVALKMIRGGRLATPDEMRRFRTEAEAVAHLDHANIVPIYEVGEHDGEPFFAMRLVEGASLAQRIAAGEFRITRDNARAMQTRIAQLMAKVALAVHHAHQRGVLHRDLKPSNVLVDAAGEPHLTDFGLAKWVDRGGSLTGTSELLGTPEYMAPEQAGGNATQVTTAVDLYSLGTILYELLTGRVAFRASTPLQTLHLVLHHEPVAPRILNPAIKLDLETICLKCMEKDSRRRYGSVSEFVEELDRFIIGQPIQARATGPIGRVVKWYRRKPVVSALASALVVMFVLAFLLVLHLWQREEAAHQDAIEAARADHALRLELEGKRLEAIEAALAAQRSGVEASVKEAEARSARAAAESNFVALSKAKQDLDAATTNVLNVADEVRWIKAQVEKLRAETTPRPGAQDEKLPPLLSQLQALQTRLVDLINGLEWAESNRTTALQAAARAISSNEALAEGERAAGEVWSRTARAASNQLERRVFEARTLSDQLRQLLEADPFANKRK